MSDTLPTQTLLSETKDGLCTITFNRPERRNALSVEMYTAWTAALVAAEADPEVRVVLVTGAGDAFTSGNDIADFIGTPPTGADSPVFQLLLQLVKMEKPLVAAVNGAAIGIGVTLLLHCDLVYAADTAKLQLPFVNLGVVPEGASSVLLPAMMGHLRASELLLLGEKFSAADAERYGLVNRVFPAGELLQKAREKALLLADKPTVSVKLAKQLLRHGRAGAIDAALHREAGFFMERLTSPAAIEAFTAFLEKRKPDFRQFGE